MNRPPSSGKESAHHRLLKLQKRIFRSLKSEVEQLLGETPVAIRRYERKYQGEFKLRKRFTEVSKEDLIRALKDAQITLIADFHTYNQAQRTALRLIRDTIVPGEPWFIGLELIPSQYQVALDRFQAGELTLEKFHKTILYKEEWGFPWSHYEPIFEWAKQNKVRLIALNRPRAFLRATDERELQERDQWAAGVITDIFHDEIRNHGRAPKMIVLYGDLHLGQKHLPQQIRKISRAFLGKPLRTLCVHQNYDPLYWDLAERGKEISTEILKLGPDRYCVFSGTPWGKLQSLVSWAEGGDIADSDNETDYLALIGTYGQTISEFFRISAPSHEALCVRTIGEADFLDDMDLSPLSSTEAAIVRHHVLHNHRIFIPKLNISYLGSPSQNGAAEMAAIWILRSATRSQQLFERTVEDFHRMLLESTFGFLGSLIINPRRKCDLPRDHLRRLGQLNIGAEAAFPWEKEARKLALELTQDQRALVRDKSKATTYLEPWLSKARHAPVLMIAARMTGQILAKRLHAALLRDRISLEQIRDTFLLPPGVSAAVYPRRYVALLQAILHHPVPATKNLSL